MKFTTQALQKEFLKFPITYVMAYFPSKWSLH